MRSPAMLRRSLALVSALLPAASLPAADASSLDMTLIRRLLRAASPRVSECAAAHTLPPGGYTVVITVAPAGGSGVALTRMPEGVTASGAACVRDAFAAVRFPPIGAGDQAIRLVWPFALR